MPGPVVSIPRDFCISYDPNQRIDSSLWAICVCEASGLAKLFMPVLLRGKDKLIGESDRAVCFDDTFGGPHWKLQIAIFKSRDALALANLRW